ncbi:hypothetical protein cypCar_00004364 [Cyprinus carpio]|nr:hypothetical protein cypCar_00004364 [Cyprinus carpio]
MQFTKSKRKNNLTRRELTSGSTHKQFIPTQTLQARDGQGDRDGGDSGARFWTDSTSVSPPLKKHTRPRRYLAENTKTEVPSPTRVNSAPI